jgi:hypothetical protein
MDALQFISSFANSVKPLTKLMEEKQAFQWPPEVKATFQTLNKALCTVPILAYPRPRKRFFADKEQVMLGLEKCSPKYRTERSE